MPLSTPVPSLLRWFSAFLVALCVTGPLLGQNNSSDDKFETLAKSASAARESGKKDEALANYHRALDVNPEWEEGWWYLGTMLYDADRFAEAIPALQKVVQLDPALGSAWNFLGLCEFETRDYANSLLHLQKGQVLARDDDPEITRVSQYHLALLLIRQGEFERAWSLLTPGVSQSSSLQMKLGLGLSLLRIPLLLQEIDPSQDALLQAAGEAAAMVAQNDNEKAPRALKELVKNYPGIPYVHHAYAVSLVAAGRDQEALLQEREEKKISPNSALPDIEISKIELRLQHREEALAAAKRAVQLASGSADAHRALAESERALGMKAKAEQDLRVAASLAEEKPKREERVAQLYASHVTPNSDSPTTATTAFDKLAQQAMASQAAGDAVKAIRDYQEALKVRPDWEAGWWNVAMLLYESRQYPSAIAALKNRVRLKPSDGTAWAVMGLSEFEAEDYSNALIHLLRGRELGFGGSPESVQLATYRLAILLNRSRQFEKAMMLLAPVADSKTHAGEIEIALGMSLLRIPMFPEQIDESKRTLVQSAGEIAHLLQNSRYNEALPRFRTLLLQYGNTPFLHYAYGAALLSLSRFEDAKEEFRQEERVSPKSELPYLRLASIALRTHQAPDAQPLAERAVRLAPDSGEAHYLLGRAFLDQGQTEAAVRELESAANLSPDSPEVHFNLAKAYGKAKLPEKEQEERGIFTRLNDLAQQQRGRQGSQSYGAAHDSSDFHAGDVGAKPETP